MNPAIPTGIENHALVSESDCMASLRHQIKANAGLLFANGPPGATQNSYEIVVMTANTDTEKLVDEKSCRYKAVLIYPGGISRTWAAAARGENCLTVEDAVQSLLHVTASALEKYQGNVVKEIGEPLEITGGVIDGKLVRQSKDRSWKSIF